MLGHNQCGDKTSLCLATLVVSRTPNSQHKQSDEALLDNQVFIFLDKRAFLFASSSGFCEVIINESEQQ